jgi:hypothetical protein
MVFEGPSLCGFRKGYSAAAFDPLQTVIAFEMRDER